MKKILFLLFILFSLNINAQLRGDDIINPLFSNNEICIYLKEFTNKMNIVLYNNYEDSTIYIDHIYLMNENHIINDIQYTNDNIIFDIDNDKIYDVIVTTNKDSWKITFDNYSEYRWYDMKICIFTKIIERTYKRNDNRIYDINGILMNNFNSKFYIYNRKKYIIR